MSRLVTRYRLAWNSDGLDPTCPEIRIILLLSTRLSLAIARLCAGKMTPNCAVAFVFEGVTPSEIASVIRAPPWKKDMVDERDRMACKLCLDALWQIVGQ